MNKNTSLIMTGCNIHQPSKKYAWGPGIHKDYVIHYIIKGRGYFETGNKKEKPSNKEKYKILKEHIDMSIEEKGEKTAINEIRKFISAYSKDMPGASKFRDEINHTNSYNDFIIKVKDFFLV